jgi:alpha-glucosidase
MSKKQKRALGKQVWTGIIVAICFLSGIIHADAQKLELKSPNGKLLVSLSIGDKISYDILYNNEILLDNCSMQLEINNRLLGENPQLIRRKYTSVDEVLHPDVPLKFSSVKNHYNQLALDFKDNYSIEFRAFDDGIAYRFVTRNKEEAFVGKENFAVHFPALYFLHTQQTDGFKTAYEELYSHIKSGEWKKEDKMAVLPLLVDTRKAYKILISESDLSDYPAMFLKSSGENGLISTFPKLPLEFSEENDRSVKIEKEAGYIARTSGKRDYPWRYFVITENDKQLIENTMTLRLAPRSQLTDISWLKPGQASWEWWNDASPYGPDVNFVSGYNLETYKYYIDFASQYGIDYIVMDEGWAKTTRDPYTPNPKVDVHEIIRYGKEKKVGVVLWLTWLTVEKNFDLFKTFGEWGVKGVKIDFMDRSDQWMVNYYERVAKEAAKYHLFVDFHGAFKPAGLEYKYPNILSYEGVRGMEQMGGCLPDNSLYLPFIRNAVGPMDYTPGAMISMQPEVYYSCRPNSASIGTRAYQMALFVVFESGVQMLADNPTLYKNNAECTEFITQVPTTWDETVALEAKAGEYVAVAKRKGNEWFIGAITNNRKKERILEIDFSFLPEGKTYQITWFEDGINAGRQAMDYRKKTSEVKAGEKIQIKLARNGGWTAKINYEL